MKEDERLEEIRLKIINNCNERALTGLPLVERGSSDTSFILFMGALLIRWVSANHLPALHDRCSHQHQCSLHPKCEKMGAAGGHWRVNWPMRKESYEKGSQRSERINKCCALEGVHNTALLQQLQLNNKISNCCLISIFSFINRFTHFRITPCKNTSRLVDCQTITKNAAKLSKCRLSKSTTSFRTEASIKCCRGCPCLLCFPSLRPRWLAHMSITQMWTTWNFTRPSCFKSVATTWRRWPIRTRHSTRAVSLHRLCPVRTWVCSVLPPLCSVQPHPQLSSPLLSPLKSAQVVSHQTFFEFCEQNWG